VSGTLSAGTVSIGVKSNTTGFGKNLHNSLIGQIGGIGKALGETIVAGAALVLGVGLKEAFAAEKINAQFAAGIKSTGNAAHLNIKTMDDLAASVAGYSGQSYESIGKTEQLLQTFTNIKNSGASKMFDQTTIAAADMAAKLGGDATNQAIRLGIALQDPEKGVAKLMRVGVAFTQSQKDSIKTFMKHGDIVGAQSVIMKELTTEFGGAAKAAGQTLPGQLARSKVAFGELSKSVVETILPIVTPAIQGLAGEITKATPQIKVFAKSFSEDLKAGLAIVWPYLKTFGSWVADHKPLVIGFGVAAMGVALAFKVYELTMKAVTVATASWAVVQGVGTAAMWLWNAAIGTSIGETLALRAMYLGSAIASGVATAAQWLLNASLYGFPLTWIIGAVVLLIGAIVAIATKTTWFQTVWQYMTSSLAAAWQWLWNSILAPIIRFVLNGFASITDGIAATLRVLSNIPGFDWAKTAADKMSGAADKAHALAKGIKDIPNKVPVAVSFSSNFSVIGQQVASLIGSKNKLAAMKAAGAATGMDNWRGGPLWVGEHGKELLDLPAGSKVTTHSDSLKRAAGGSGDTFNIYEAVSAMATAMQVSRRQAALGAV